METLYSSAINNNSDIVLYNAFWSYDSKKEKKNIFTNDTNGSSDVLKELFIGNIMPAIWAKLIRNEYIN